MANPSIRPSRTHYVWTCIALFLLTGALSFFAFPVVSKMVRSYSWPAVDVVVTDHAVRHYRKRGNMFDYEGHVQFRYMLDTKQYVSSRLNVSPGYYSALSEDEAWIFLRTKYPTGSQKKAYVDPHNPSYAILEKGISDSLFFLLLVMILLMPLGALLGLIVGTRSSVFKA
ncbi:DUF3592 domain-containing protein [Candidatus Peribacteria bacterium]|nr:MAG: DUF3592 domain-containing protein [Candidatus Peribacteria bacterium]